MGGKSRQQELISAGHIAAGARGRTWEEELKMVSPCPLTETGHTVLCAWTDFNTKEASSVSAFFMQPPFL